MAALSTNVAVDALGRARRPPPATGDTERSFFSLRTSLGVAIAQKTSPGGVRYQDVVVGPQDFLSHFRPGKLGLNIKTAYTFSQSHVIVQSRSFNTSSSRNGANTTEF